MNGVLKVIILGTPGNYLDVLAGVLQAAPGVEIVDAAEGNEPDVVLVVDDTPRPVTGDSLLQARRRWPLAKKVALVDSPLHLSGARLQGVDAVLLKNASTGVLLSLVKRWRDQRYPGLLLRTSTASTASEVTVTR